MYRKWARDPEAVRIMAMAPLWLVGGGIACGSVTEISYRLRFSSCNVTQLDLRLSLNTTGDSFQKGKHRGDDDVIETIYNW